MSGIPDYRGPEGRFRSRKPMMYREFIGSAEGRARYWGRSAVGWHRMATAAPNAAHHALARLEAGGALPGTITQNVDGLHQAAGSRNVVELHGSLARVRCLGCDDTVPRDAFQERLLAINEGWAARLLVHESAGGAAPAPDGDAELGGEDFTSFRVPDCHVCGGVLKPDVIFFGENVPRATVERAWRLLEDAEVLLVVGSSLTVFSGRRFLYGAREAAVPVAIVNLGPTRGDEMATVKVEGRLGEVLPKLADALLQEASSS